jgi:protein tyrosine/serine phosphatase
MPFKPWYIDLFSRFFAALATTSGAVLVHCTAGKDRTGLIAALTHQVLGVHRDNIIADYLLTNRARSFELHGAAVASGIAEIAGRTPDEAAVRAAMEVDATYLVETVLGVTPTLRDEIATRLTANDNS